MEDMQAFKTRFDKLLKSYLEEKITLLSKTIIDDSLQKILQQTNTLFLSGGKRFRPYVAFFLYTLYSGKNEDALITALLSLELFHAFALAHDDIMDEGEVRHGQQTLHVFAQSILKNKKVAESEAILIGDLLFSWSQELIAGLDASGRSYYYKMVTDTMLGQMIDVSLPLKKDVTDQDVYTKMLLKTARYTFSYPMHIGLSLANAPEIVHAFCDAFGEALGVGFQIQDDILDVTAESGKTPFSDVKAGQPTVLTVHIFTHGTLEEKTLLSKYFGKNFSNDAYAVLSELFMSSGAVAVARERADALFQRATTLIAESVFDETQKKNLTLLVEVVQKRKT